MKAKWYLVGALLVAVSLPLAAQTIPPVSDPTVVATYCTYCGWIHLDKGETHRSDCPSMKTGGGSSSGGSAVHHTDWASTPSGMIANTVTTALGQTLSSWISGESKPDFSSLVEDRPVLTNTNQGRSNGQNNVVYDERSGRVGIWDNNKRRWLLQPWYYEDLIINDLKAIRAEKMVKKKAKWGVINADNWTIVPFEYGSTWGFQTENAPIILFYADKTGGPCKICVPDASAKHGFKLLDEEFEDAKAHWPKGQGPCVAVKKDGKWGVIGRNGAYTVEPAWEGVVPCGDYMGENTVLTQIQTGWGLQIGEREVLPHAFESISLNAARTNIIAKYKDGKTGVANMNGQFFMPPVFDKIERFTTELVKDKSFFKVTQDGKSGLYTDDGVLAAAPAFGDDADYEILALASESQSYSQWLKREVKALAAAKDEFETTADFEARKADPELMEKYLAKVMPDPEQRFVAWSLRNANTGKKKHRLTMSAYNADKGCFFITDSATPAFGAYELYVPIDKAAAFKEEMLKDDKLQEAIKTAKYKVYLDRNYISEMTFTLEDGTAYTIKTL